MIIVKNYFRSEEHSFFSLLLLFDFRDNGEQQLSKSTFGDDVLASGVLLMLVLGNVQEDSLLFSSK